MKTREEWLAEGWNGKCAWIRKDGEVQDCEHVESECCDCEVYIEWRRNHERDN